MSESRPISPSTPESEQFVPDILPEVPKTSLDKEAITERIMDRVIEAAEHDEPVEQQFELAHEIKDQDSHDSFSDAPMQSIGDILQQHGAASQQQPDHTTLKQVDPMQPTHQSPFADQSAVSIYKQSIMYGFGAALIVAIVLAVLLFAN